MRGDIFAVPMSREFRKRHGGREILIPFPERLKGRSVRQIEIRPAQDGSYVETIFVYEEPEGNLQLDMYNVLSIDTGVDNLAGCVASDGATFLVDGRPLKAINHHWNKRTALERSRLEIENGQRTSRRLMAMTRKRNRRIRDYLRNAAKAIVDFAREHNCGTIIIGWNKEQKQHCRIGHANTQSFVQIPFDMLRQMLAAKCEKYGIRFVKQEESYTSKASALDGDFIPTWRKYDDPNDKPKYVFAGTRVKRGLYRAAVGTLLNADIINGALSIARKCKQNGPEYSSLRLCMGGLYTPARIRFR